MPAALPDHRPAKTSVRLPSPALPVRTSVTCNWPGQFLEVRHGHVT